MLIPLISILIISLSVMNISSMYQNRVSKIVMNQNSQNIKKFATQEKNLLISLDFYCQSNINKCTNLNNSEVVIPLSEILKYSSLKNINSFNIATIQKIIVDQDNQKFVIKNNFTNSDIKNRYNGFNMKNKDFCINDSYTEKKFDLKTKAANIKALEKLELENLDNEFPNMKDLKKEIVYNFTKQKEKRGNWDLYKNEIKSRLTFLKEK